MLLIHTILSASYCFLRRKDKNFKANHNRLQPLLSVLATVFCGAKIKILKQITTKSLGGETILYCFLRRKDKNFKANHNKIDILLPKGFTVFCGAKIKILKQITTVFDYLLPMILLFFAAQR